MSAAPRVLTFGCRLNAYESEVMRGHAAAAGRQNLVIVNSCAVTAEAERQVRQAIRKARREHPEAEIVVTGCAAQIDPARYAAMPEVSRVLGNGEKLKPESWIGTQPRVAVDDIMTLKETASHLTQGYAERARGFLQIQQGCDHRCTFCVIPFGRGNNRSVPVGAVVAEARRLVGNGLREIVLTGVDICGWGSDLPGGTRGRPRLGELCRRLLALVPELPRLRLSSLDPAALDDELFRLLAEEPRLMPHLHLSVQSGADLILKRMKRRHLRADLLAVAERARRARPDLVLGADLIAGFPTETAAHHAQTLALVEAAGLTWLHVFPYSERPGTPAARMPKVPVAERRARAAELRALGERQAARFLAAQQGREVAVLLEREGFGHSQHFAPVVIAGAAGALRRGRVTRLQDGRLEAA
jgi:threonylcarbamoyladenosine tRNA methylthiotransferase MtaB